MTDIKIDSIKEYLSWHSQSIGKLYEMNGQEAPGCTMEEFVLKHGREYTSGEYPARLVKYRGKMRECFYNAFRLTDKLRGIKLNDVPSPVTYVEGYAVNHFIPVLHAWCVDLHGNVIDPTWDNQEECQYFGVPMKFNFVKREILDRGCYGVIDDWERKWPLVNGAYKKKEFHRHA